MIKKVHQDVIIIFLWRKMGLKTLHILFQVQGRLTMKMLINFVALKRFLFFYKILVVLHYLVFIPGFAITIIL